jgi:hypothetical protein
MVKAIVGLLLVAAVASAEDSPLVALAKRANRKASKTPVITNDTVARSRGRFSLPAGQETATAADVSSASAGSAASPAAPPPPAAMPAPVVTPKPAAAPTQGVTPGTLGTGAYAESTARNIQPAQSTVRNIEPQSSARNVTPASSARSIPAPTPPTVVPQSTARNIQPQVVPVQRPPR